MSRLAEPLTSAVRRRLTKESARPWAFDGQLKSAIASRLGYALGICRTTNTVQTLLEACSDGRAQLASPW
jgi:hypothetical protein